MSYRKGQRIALKRDLPFRELTAGDTGIIRHVDSNAHYLFGTLLVKMDGRPDLKEIVLLRQEIKPYYPPPKHKDEPVRYYYYNPKRNIVMIWGQNKYSYSLGTDKGAPVSMRRLRKEGPEAMGFIRIGRE